MTKTLINTRIETDGLYFDVVTTRTEKLSEKDLALKYVGVFDPVVKTKAFVIKNDRFYIACSQEVILWPSWSGPILDVLSKFRPDAEIFVFDTSQELFKWLAE